MRTMSKAEEKVMLKQLVAKLPDGYVRDIMQDMQPEIERAIESDFGFVPFSQRRIESELHRVEMLDARTKLDAVKREIRELEQKRNALENGVSELRATIRQFAKL